MLCVGAATQLAQIWGFAANVQGNFLGCSLHASRLGIPASEYDLHTIGSAQRKCILESGVFTLGPSIVHASVTVMPPRGSGAWAMGSKVDNCPQAKSTGYAGTLHGI